MSEPAWIFAAAARAGHRARHLDVGRSTCRWPVASGSGGPSWRDGIRSPASRRRSKAPVAVLSATGGYACDPLHARHRRAHRDDRGRRAACGVSCTFWSGTRGSTRRGSAQLLAWATGVVIFIESNITVLVAGLRRAAAVRPVPRVPGEAGLHHRLDVGAHLHPDPAERLGGLQPGHPRGPRGRERAHGVPRARSFSTSTPSRRCSSSLVGHPRSESTSGP